MINLKSDKRLWAGIGIIFVALFVFLMGEDSSYHKVTRLERIVHTVMYSIDNSAVAAARFFIGEDSFYLTMPYYRQENGLTCEVAALRTALNYQGIYVSEGELLENLTFDTREPMSRNGIWGDPDINFLMMWLINA